VAAAGVLAGVLAAPATGFVEAAPDPTWQTNGRVNAIVQVGDIVYLGGRFTEVHDGNGTSLPRSRLAAIDLTTGAPTAWDPGADDEVFALAAAPDGTRIYAGGAFRTAGGAALFHVAALDATTGAAVPDWRPKVSAPVRALAAWTDRLYLGGTFGSISGTTRRGIAALDAATGKVIRKWYPGDVDRSVRALVATPTRLVVGGTFSAIGVEPRAFVTAITHAGAKVKPWATPPLDQVLALSVLDDHVYVGSRSNEVTKHVLATGEQLWAVSGDGDVQALHAQDGIVYIGGHFEIFTGQPENKIAAVSTDGSRVEWGAFANSVHGVFAMAGGTHLFIGGDFTIVSGEARRGFAAFAEGADPPEPGQGLPFADDFTDGFANWSSVKGFALDPAEFGTAAPSAGSALVLDKAFAFRDLGAPEPEVCLRSAVHVASHEGSLTLLRLREQDGSGLARVFIDGDRRFRVRADLSDITYTIPNEKLPLGWSTLELCGDATADQITFAVDGRSLGTFAGDFGALGIGRIQIGDDNEKTATYNFDDVVASDPVPPIP
jgi:outer membrane protein assembly factor BamB